MLPSYYRSGIALIYSLYVLFPIEAADRITYISVEHPQIGFYHRDYVEYANLTCRRYGRTDPVYYVGLTIDFIAPLDNNIKVDFYFYEFLTNRYKRNFVEMHFRWCNLIHKDPFFGAAMKQGKLDAPCPYPPGVYTMSNMTIPVNAIPKGFPFTKGRIQANLTFVPKNVLIGSGHIDMEVRTLKKKSRKR